MKTLQKIVASVAVASSLLMPDYASAQEKEKPAVSGVVEYVASEERPLSFERLNLFYGLPFDVQGYSFVELYQDGRGYFGKANLSRKIKGGVSARSEVFYANQPFTRFGVGAQVDVPLPGNASGFVKYLPVFFGKDNKEGAVMHDMAVLGFSAGASAGRYRFVAFGEGNPHADGGFKWGYGEAKVETTFKDRLNVGAGAILRSNGTAKPNLEYAIFGGIKF